MHSQGVTRRWAPDVLGLAWTVLAAIVVMAPVLRLGVSLGSFDLLSRIGLTQHAGVAVHSQFPADQVLYFLPLTNAAWHQVHNGQLPLWNPYNVLGAPLAFSWQSGVFSVPVLLSYLAPLHDAYTVIVLAKLLIAGTGVYTLCRVLGMGSLSAAFGGTVFELSGPMLHYSGWAMTGVTCWAGWVLAAAILLVRGGHRLRYSVALAVAVALAIYGGHPESFAVLGVSVVIFLAVYLAVLTRTSGVVLRRPVIDLAVATACGLGLGAPLLLPGLQVVQASGRAAASGASAYPLTHISDLLVGLQGIDFRVPPPYVGVIAAVLAVVGLGIRWRRAEILGLGAVAVVAVLLTFQSPFYSVVQGAPVIGRITWNRDVMLLALALAVLGAAGIDTLVRDAMSATMRRWLLGALGGAGLVVAAVTLAVGLGAEHTGGAVRARLAWAASEVAVAAALLWLSGFGRATTHGKGEGVPARVRRGVAGTLLVAQSAFLVATGVSFWSISSGYFSPTPAVTALQRAVGPALVSVGPCRPRPFSYPYSTEVGIRPNANIAFEIHEFAVYEPVLPTSYYQSWLAVSGESVAPNLRRVGLFCPQITTATEARIYGISYVLVAAGAKGPTGAVRDGTVGGEQLFRVPGAAQATLSALAHRGASLPLDALGSAVPVTHLGPKSWRIVTDASSSEMLRLRVTALPGWHATVDGRPLPLETWASGAMLEAQVPAGHHVVVLQYWPELFTVGLALAAAVVVGFGGAVLVTRRRAVAAGSPRDRSPTRPRHSRRERVRR